MLSDLFYKLLNSGIIAKGIWETVYMTGLSTLVAYGVGLPLGIILGVTSPEGLRPIRWLNRVLGFVVNVFRSIPFIILMVAMLPVAKALVGTSLGNKAMIVTLIIAAAPENSASASRMLMDACSSASASARSNACCASRWNISAFADASPTALAYAS